MRDHHIKAREIFLSTKATPGKESALICLKDGDYCSAMSNYDRQLADQLDPIWEENYLQP